ncbi:adenylate/guanylate cyclase domain-containing protein [Desulfobacca acetoxidans]|uniref:Adenylate/guanylate cyclase n=1 Tax=Desulfobacca acetoxidans (strain ATCC 700848 / DSM 11109 / ASRB2) TaxID=880072 RepID=F2NCM5_DESAR|nr:adenylate/guanylate cyclase domain-containing protein [Desulfobacca acetoxidans]AEB09159.1 adenylate/guanylate cyclase [Desulfobacca acetoxidans DSM 11109]
MSEIDIIQAIELAISHELEARRSYLELSDQADDLELKRLLQEIAQEEAGHEASLRSRLRLYQEKHLLRDTISRYVSPNVCEEILKNPQLLQLGGKRQRVTVLFADIWGFTSMSEKLTPETVVEMLNHFFTAMVDIVFEHEGTLDKFIGDNIMAVFGTPLEIAQPALKAARCALAMHRRLRQMQTDLCQIKRIGIGINTGEVIAGNIGSHRHMDFTVIGDVVNIAARLESLTRELDADIIIGPETYQEIAPYCRLEPCAPVVLRGRSEPLLTYRLLGEV